MESQIKIHEFEVIYSVYLNRCFTSLSMKTILLFIIALVFSSCTTDGCACDKMSKNDSIIYATDIQIEKEKNKMILMFHCATIVTGIASMSDLNGNNEHCENMYDVQCVSYKNTPLQLSENFKYFTDIMQPQDIFFKELQNKENSYFELTLDSERKITSISKLNIH